MNDITSVALSCVHWIARRGPTDLVHAALLLLLRLVDNYATTGFKLANLTLKIASQSQATTTSNCQWKIRYTQIRLQEPVLRPRTPSCPRSTP